MTGVSTTTLLAALGEAFETEVLLKVGGGGTTVLSPRFTLKGLPSATAPLLQQRDRLVTCCHR